MCGDDLDLGVGLVSEIMGVLTYLGM